jgi:hypothetical protein
VTTITPPCEALAPPERRPRWTASPQRPHSISEERPDPGKRDSKSHPLRGKRKICLRPGRTKPMVGPERRRGIPVFARHPLGRNAGGESDASAGRRNRRDGENSETVLDRPGSLSPRCPSSFHFLLQLSRNTNYNFRLVFSPVAGQYVAKDSVAGLLQSVATEFGRVNRAPSAN